MMNKTAPLPAALLQPIGILSLLFLLLFPAAFAVAQQASIQDKVNLGPAINSAYDEIYPLISPDGNILYFARKGHPQNIEDPNADVGSRLRHKDDIWYSTRGPEGKWMPAVNIGPPLNNSNYNYVCGVLPDNNTLLLGNRYNKSGTMGQGVSMTHRTKDGWSFPENVDFRQFSNKRQFAEYSISPHANVLILSVQPDDGYPSQAVGMRDLYVSFKQEDGVWSAPENIGPQVNSTYEEITPFLASDGKTLYFSSDRLGGLGKNDVYVTRRLDDTWKNWSEPRNLGHPVNTAGWDAYFTVTGNDNIAYVVSTTQADGEGATAGFGKSDIFRVTLDKSVAPIPITIVSGRVLDGNGNVVPTKIVYERLSDNTPMGTAAVNPATGEYKIALPAGELYGFHPESQGFYADNQHIDLRNLDSYEEIHRDITLLPIQSGTTITLNNIFFEFDKATLRPESGGELKRLVAFLGDHPDMRIELAGHTDDVGTTAYNEKLSFERATSVKNYLVDAGIDSSRVIAKGYGESRPVATNDTEEGRQKNRRVEFTIL